MSILEEELSFWWKHWSVVYLILIAAVTCLPSSTRGKKACCSYSGSESKDYWNSLECKHWTSLTFSYMKSSLYGKLFTMVSKEWSNMRIYTMKKKLNSTNEFLNLSSCITVVCYSCIFHLCCGCFRSPSGICCREYVVSRTGMSPEVSPEVRLSGIRCLLTYQSA